MHSLHPRSRYICHSCLKHLSRPHSTLFPHPQLRPQSTTAARNDPFPPSSALEGKLTKHWTTDFRGKFKMTWASRHARFVSQAGENHKVWLFNKPPVRKPATEGARRGRDGIVRRKPRLPGQGMLRPLRRDVYKQVRGIEEEAEEEDGLVPSPPSPPLGVPKPTPPPLPPIYAPTKQVPGGYRLNRHDLNDVNWYWETFPPSITQITQASHFFSTHGKTAKLLRSIAHFRLMPDSDVPEVAFVGRSNVGKSSLLNALVNADINSLLARVSARPGFTKTMNMYGLGPGTGPTIETRDGHDRIVGNRGLTLVDMPGYGEGSLASWGAEIMKYAQSRRQLRRVFVLLDAEHGVKDKDRALLASLRLTGVPHQIILNKVDKLYIPAGTELKRYSMGKSLSKVKPKGSAERVREVMQKLRGDIQPPVGAGALGELLACSAEVRIGGRRLGVDAVRCAIWRAAGL